MVKWWLPGVIGWRDWEDLEHRTQNVSKVWGVYSRFYCMTQ